MTRSASLAPKTYLTDAADDATVLDFIQKLEAAGRTVAHVDPALVIDGSTRIPLTASMVDVLRDVAEAGDEVTIGDDPAGSPTVGGTR